MLSRFAENSYWLARYVERAENLARILDVHETFARDIQGVQDWLPIVQIEADEEEFFKRFKVASKNVVTWFYTLDSDNPNSIISCIKQARENARAIRHLISTDMWTHLNVFYKRLSALDTSCLADGEMNHTFSMIKEACQIHVGIADGTMYRDEVLSFHELGKYAERADMASRLLDIKYHRLLPSLDDVGSIIDVNQWNILLRSVSGYHAYRRTYSGKTTVASVVGFLVKNENFVRSIGHCLARICRHLEWLEKLLEKEEPSAVLIEARKIHQYIAQKKADEIIIGGMHEFIDELQKHLIELNNRFYQVYFNL